MANKNKAKGTAAETRVVKFINGYEGLSAERLALHGSKDEGDIRVRIYEDRPDGGWEFRLEVKGGKQTQNPTRADLTEWFRQTEVEEKNAGCPCVLVVARHGKNPKDYDVYSGFNFGVRNHYWLDEFVQHILK